MQRRFKAAEPHTFFARREDSDDNIETNPTATFTFFAGNAVI
jgi:hypothetical protein